MKYFSLHTTAHIISLATAENSDMEFHKKELQRHCRVCAGLLDKKYAYTCQEQTNKLLLQKLGIDVDEDQPDVQPKLFCQSCRTKYSETVKSSLVVFEWQSHSDPGSSCEICCFFKSKKKGGRPKKEKKNRGRPQSHSVQFITNRFLHSTLPSYRVSSTLSLSRFLLSTTVPLNDLKCSVCSNIVDQPVETPCRKRVCSICIASLLRSCDLEHFPCPSCKESHEITQSSFPEATEVVMKVLGDLLVTCDKPLCTEVVAQKN